MSIKCIFYDFDGVFTDNGVFVSSSGLELVKCDRSDGLAISKIQALNITQIIVSTEKNKAALARSKKLNIPCFLGVNDKKMFIENFCDSNNIHLANCAFFGNDLNDLSAMKLCKYRICPMDAYPEIIEVATYISQRKGGNGAIRMCYNYIVENL